MGLWKYIEGYENIYKISTRGQIMSVERQVFCIRNKSYSTIKEKILKPQITTDGYLRVMLCKNKIKTQHSIHRLVASNMIHNPENKPHINHKNGIKSDNRVCNLEWCTPKENIHHAWETGLSNTIGLKNGKGKLSDEQVLAIRQSTEKNCVLASRFGIAESTIRNIKNNISRKILNHTKN